MSVSNVCVIVLLLVYVSLVHADGDFPEYRPDDFRYYQPYCTELIEEVDTTVAGFVDVGFTNKHKWFCPKEAYDRETIAAFKCKSGESCEVSYPTIGKGDPVLEMQACLNQRLAIIFLERVNACITWQTNGVMQHLLKQFPSFKTVNSHLSQIKPDEARVPRCHTNNELLFFSDFACWYDGSDMVFLKPDYQFNFKQSTNTKICAVSHDAITHSDVTVVDSAYASYDSWFLDYVPQAANSRQYTSCKYYGNDELMDWLASGFFWKLTKATIFYKNVQFYDYRIERRNTICPDMVTRPCFDNAFSFFGKTCGWVHASSRLNGVSLHELLRVYPASDTVNLLAYGKSRFVMDLTGKHIDVSVSFFGGDRPSPPVSWDGTSTTLKLNSRLYIVESPNFSCSGCKETGKVPTGRVVCGVPQECMTCHPWQRVVQDGSDNTCDPPFKLRTCANCAQHEMRSSSETLCEACPALEPMRRAGACAPSSYCGDIKCMECNHTQYFEKTSADGCLYFMSVVDGLTFSGGVLFNRAYVDQYKPVGSTRAPQAVPALKYRNLMQDGNKWDTSSVASNCEQSMFYDGNYAGILTRNVWGKRIQYRRWCGHEEMLKDNNAQLSLLGCNEVVLFPSTISLQGLFTFANNIHVLVKERMHLGNRVAEIKLTQGAVQCYYEIRREGRTDDCTYCNGTFYTKDCGPTYNQALDTPLQTGPGSCQKCDEQCVQPEHFFEASEFSCWSNGTSRVSGSVQYGSVNSIAQAMSTARNYWYKQAVCVACKKLTAASVPQIVTRCGNKVTFEVWHPTLQITVLQANRPRRRACCAIDSIFASGSEYNSELGTRCVTEASDGTFDVTRLVGGSTPLCQTYVPDLSTAHIPFCPPGWFFDRAVAGCAGQLETWNQKCCSICSSCATQGSLKTNEYKLCSGDTAEDTQLAGCVTSCAEKNYQVGTDTCVACESCG